MNPFDFANKTYTDLQQRQAQTGQEVCGKDTCEPYTLRGDAERRIGYHRTEADKADQAAAFFREHPEFDLFVRLVRSGAIQF